VDGGGKQGKQDIEAVKQDGHDDADDRDPEGSRHLVCHDRKDHRCHADCHETGVREDVAYRAHHLHGAECAGPIDKEAKAGDQEDCTGIDCPAGRAPASIASRTMIAVDRKNHA